MSISLNGNVKQIEPLIAQQIKKQRWKPTSENKDRQREKEKHHI